MYPEQQSIQLTPELYGASAPPPQPSKRPAWLSANLALGALLGVAGAMLAIGGRASAHDNPSVVVQRWHQTLQRGDVARLESDPQLNAQAWVRAEIQRAGEEEYTRVLGLFSRAQNEGRTEYNRLVDAITRNGQSQFNALPYERQQAITRQSHDLWVYEHGFESVPDAATVGTWQVLANNPIPAALLQRLGTPALGADEQSLLGNRAANDPAVTADPMLVELAARRTAAGQQVIDRLRQRVYSEGERAYRRQHHDERERIDNRSHDRWILEHGFTALPAADRARVGTLDAMINDADALTTRLGVQRLTPDEQREVVGHTREAFVAARARFVEARGTEVVHRALLSGFGNARYTLDDFAAQGEGGRDLVRRQTARGALSWTQVGDGLRRVPSAITLRWAPREAEWRVDEVTWRPRDAHDDPASSDTTPTSPPAPDTEPSSGSDDAERGAT